MVSVVVRCLFVGHPERHGIEAGHRFGGLWGEAQFAGRIDTWPERDDRAALALFVHMIEPGLSLGF